VTGGSKPRRNPIPRRSAWFALVAAGLSCRGPSSPVTGAPRGNWSYELTASADGRELDVQATLPASAAALQVDDQAQSFVRDVEVREGAGWRAAGAKSSCPGGCVVRYRFLLGDAARAAADADIADAFGGALVSPASAWALHAGGARALSIRIHWVGPGTFLSGAPPARDASDAVFESNDVGLEDAPFSAFGSWRTRMIMVAGQTIAVGIAPSERAMDDDALAGWVRTSAEPLATYFGHLAAARPLVLVVPTEGSTLDGETLGGGGSSVLLRVGRSVTARDAHQSWVATHELVHANFPSFGFPHKWFEEGVATYVEPIARIRIGALSRDAMWIDLLENLPSGLPESGDQGLEKTHTWGRTYYGGALFCLTADVSIRQRTRGGKSLDDALRAIAAMGAGAAVQVDLAHALAIGDAATGTDVLQGLYRTLAAAPGTVDLAAQWRALGVSRRPDKGVAYDDGAPLAWIRRAITP
jgi:hypothetical protein